MISIGWDPGMFSLNDFWRNSTSDGDTYTFWGKGLSQGHSDAIRRVAGVKMVFNIQFHLLMLLLKSKKWFKTYFKYKRKHTKRMLL